MPLNTCLINGDYIARTGSKVIIYQLSCDSHRDCFCQCGFGGSHVNHDGSLHGISISEWGIANLRFNKFEPVGNDFFYHDFLPGLVVAINCNIPIDVCVKLIVTAYPLIDRITCLRDDGLFREVRACLSWAIRTIFCAISNRIRFLFDSFIKGFSDVGDGMCLVA